MVTAGLMARCGAVDFCCLDLTARWVCLSKTESFFPGDDALWEYCLLTDRWKPFERANSDLQEAAQAVVDGLRGVGYTQKMVWSRSDEQQRRRSYVGTTPYQLRNLKTT